MNYKLKFVTKNRKLATTDSASGIYQSLLSLHQMITDAKDSAVFDLSLVLEKKIVLKDYSKNYQKLKIRLYCRFLQKTTLKELLKSQHPRLSRFLLC